MLFLILLMSTEPEDVSDATRETNKTSSTTKAVTFQHVVASSSSSQHDNNNNAATTTAGAAKTDGGITSPDDEDHKDTTNDNNDNNNDDDMGNRETGFNQENVTPKPKMRSASKRFMGVGGEEHFAVKVSGTHVDLATGSKTHRCQTIHAVTAEDQKPQRRNIRQRVVKMTKHTVEDDYAAVMAINPLTIGGGGGGGGRKAEALDDDDNNDDEVIDDGLATPAKKWEPKRYRIVAARQNDTIRHEEASFSTPFLRIQRMIQYDDTVKSSYISQILHWTFAASFVAVIFVVVVAFLSLIIVFACFVLIVDQFQPECIVGAQRTEEFPHLTFSDAYQLSWTVRFVTFCPCFS